MYKKLILTLCLSNFSSVVFANAQSLLKPESIGILSENKKYIYIHIEERNIGSEIKVENEDGSSFKLPSNVFSKDGLYILAEKKFLWSIDGEIDLDSGRVYPMNDGIHLMRRSSFISRDAGKYAFSFYKNGKLIKEYTVADFCTDESIFGKGAFNHSDLVWSFNQKIDNSSYTYSLTSCDKDFLINIKTGNFSAKDDFLTKMKNRILRWTGNALDSDRIILP